MEAAPSHNAAGNSLMQRLAESVHPVALLFFMGFKIGALLAYLFGLLFTSNFILVFIVVVLLTAADFWNCKNVSGRLLVGLRWWNETSPTGESIWVFETADPSRVINPIDSKVFWMFLYGSPVFWVILGIFAMLKLQFLSLILVIIAIALTITNAVAFTRCDKFGRANSIAGGVFSRIGGGIASRMFSSGASSIGSWFGSR